MGHLSSYSKAELALQSGCGKALGPYSTAKCGDYQPDMEMWMCAECRAKFNEALERFRRQENESK